jgi:hypothetical protein
MPRPARWALPLAAACALAWTLATATAAAQAPAPPRPADKDALVTAFLATRAAEPEPVRRLLNVRSVAQECGNYCGPATILAAVTYSGATTTQAQMAREAGTPGCGINAAGTCITAIRDVLNLRYLNPPAPNWFRTAPLQSAERLWGVAGVSVAQQGVPFGVLINPNPADGSPYCLPTWCNTTASSVHFVLVSGMHGAHDGSDASAGLYYVDSATGQHLGDAAGANGWWTSVNGLASVVAANNGYGGCDGVNALVW